MATRSALLCLAVLAAGCGSTAAPAAPAAPSTAAPTTASTAPTTTAAPATTVERPWEQAYRDQLEAGYATDSPADHTKFCASIEVLTDAEIRLDFSAKAGDGSHFDQLMAERGETPTAADYDRALDIAVEEARENCA